MLSLLSCILQIFILSLFPSHLVNGGGVLLLFFILNLSHIFFVPKSVFFFMVSASSGNLGSPFPIKYHIGSNVVFPNAT